MTVPYNQLYKGSIRLGYLRVPTTAGGKIVKKLYKGSTLIYQLGFDPVTFNASSSLQTFTIPLGVSKIHVDCVASRGYTYQYDASHIGYGGNGGRVQCDMSIAGGTTLYIMVGSIPTSDGVIYNASDIRIGGTDLGNRIVVAGGGGGGTAGYRHALNGGAGGGITGAGTAYSPSHYGTGAGGGTQSYGGAASTNSTYGSASAGAGQFGYGGTRGTGGNIGTSVGQAGAGGSGWYGGGGGMAFGIFLHASEQGSWGCGGGGGSSYTNSSYCYNVVHTQGYTSGAGYVTISYVD